MRTGIIIAQILVDVGHQDVHVFFFEFQQVLALEHATQYLRSIYLLMVLMVQCQLSKAPLQIFF